MKRTKRNVVRRNTLKMQEKEGDKKTKASSELGCGGGN